MFRTGKGRTLKSGKGRTLTDDSGVIDRFDVPTNEPSEQCARVAFCACNAELKDYLLMQLSWECLPLFEILEKVATLVLLGFALRV